MKRLDCLLMSTGRAASTAIYRYLNVAGDLDLPTNKEPHHWCNVRQYQGLYEELLRCYCIEDADAYWRLYANSKLALDASCGYFFYIDDVIEKLRNNEQRPRVVFLYREPVGRAASFFNELKRKGLTGAATFEEDLARTRGDGLWWERYYDNVRYDYGFRKMQAYFNEIIAVNYDYFAQNHKTVLKALLKFLDVSTECVDDLEVKPMNSSQQALASIFMGKHRLLGSVGKLFPSPVKRLVRGGLENHFQRRRGDTRVDKQLVEPYLTESLAEYSRFRERIGYRDLATFRR